MFIPAIYTTTKSLVLSGGDYVNLGNVLGTNGTTALTIEGYIKPTLGATMAIWNKRDAVGTGSGVLFYVTATGQIQFFLEGATSANRLRAESVSTLTTGVWNHFAMCYTGSGTVAGVTMYINGVSSTITNVQNTFSGSAANARPLWLGNRENGTGSFAWTGNMYRVSRWSKALSGAEVTEAMNLIGSSGLLIHSAAPTYLEANLRMGNDPIDSAVSGTGVIMDRSGNHNGTPQGTVAGDIVTDAP